MEFCLGLPHTRGSRTSWISLTFLCSMLCMWTCVESWSYFYSNETMQWQKAREWCQEHYTDMVAIQNQEELEHLNSWLPRKAGYYWIGIRKIKNVWTWVGTNKALTAAATNWAQGEPNNGKKGRTAGKNEDCVEMYIKRELQTGKWNDERCTKLKTALCYAAACKNDSCHNGECVETINSHECACFEGFYGETCDQAVKCDKEEVTVPYKGSVECTHKNGNFSYDSLCHYSCEEGYQLSSSKALRCNSSKQWSELPPTCELVQCKELSSPERGSMKYSDPLGPSSYQSTRVFTCEEGYELTGSPSNTLKCEASGLWNASQPKCVAAQCPALQELDHGAVSCDNETAGTFSYGDTCSFSCEAGYRLVGKGRVTCTSAAEWSQAMPRCEAIGCPVPELPARVQMSCSDSSTLTPHPPGTVCSFSCDEGHELQGVLSMECSNPDQWTATPPHCTAVRCPLLQAPENGHINCSNSEPVYNTQCFFTCEEDFSLDGHELLTCDRHGNWTTGEKPTCQAPSPVIAIASGLGTGGALLSGLSMAMWVLKRLRQKASSKFELNSNSDIEAPPQVYKNSIDSLI